jgi:hypothetical protein
MYNLAHKQPQQSQIVSHGSLSSLNAHAVALNFTNSSTSSNQTNKHDKILSPKKKKRKYNNMSPTMMSMSTNSGNIYDYTSLTPGKIITGDSFLSTGCNSNNNNLASNQKSQMSSSSMSRTNSNLTTSTNAAVAAIRSINIVDRVIDMSKYTKSTTLYTMCRDWTNASASLTNTSSNLDSPSVASSPFKSTSPKQGGEKKSGSQEATSAKDVIALPDPVLDEDDDEYNISIEQLNENIRLNIRSSEESDIELIKRLNVDDDLETHALLKLHVNRWKMAKREWFNYYSVQSKPYENSYQTLKSIFEDIA